MDVYVIIFFIDKHVTICIILMSMINVLENVLNG